MCLILSMIVPSSVQKIRLLCLPMTSITRSFRHKSPISLRCSIVKIRIRSSFGCRISTIRPFAICFLRSIQKFGAVIGLGLLDSVKYISGREALADKTSRFCPAGVLTVKRSSSASGCAILAILPFNNSLRSSWARFATTIPSKAIIISSLSFRHLNDVYRDICGAKRGLDLLFIDRFSLSTDPVILP